MKKILIIEDDNIVGNIYRHRFQAEGFQVALATDGEAGLNAVAKDKPDIVILDLMLPGLSGVEVLKRLRATESSKSLPVIVMSNSYMSGLLQEARKAGADHCLNKAQCTAKHLVELANQTLVLPSAPVPAAMPASGAAPAPGVPAVPVHQPPLSNRAEDDAASRAQMRQAFLNRAPEALARLRSTLQTLIKCEVLTLRLDYLFSLRRQVHSLIGNAAIAGLTGVAKLCSALEALLKELHEKPDGLNVSTLRTLAHTIDFLGGLLEHSRAPGPENFPQPTIMVVDDEPLSRRAVIQALAKADLECVSVEDPNAALSMLAQKRYDLIFLDVNMPELNGFDVCRRLRALPGHARTPVVFVTALTDFESRAQSTLSGGNDLIAKPFLFVELAVKALTYVLKGQLGIS